MNKTTPKELRESSFFPYPSEINIKPGSNFKALGLRILQSIFAVIYTCMWYIQRALGHLTFFMFHLLRDTMDTAVHLVKFTYMAILSLVFVVALALRAVGYLLLDIMRPIVNALLYFPRKVSYIGNHYLQILFPKIDHVYSSRLQASINNKINRNSDVPMWLKSDLNGKIMTSPYICILENQNGGLDLKRSLASGNGFVHSYKTLMVIDENEQELLKKKYYLNSSKETTKLYAPRFIKASPLLEYIKQWCDGREELNQVQQWKKDCAAQGIKTTSPEISKSDLKKDLQCGILQSEIDKNANEDFIFAVVMQKNTFLLSKLYKKEALQTYEKGGSGNKMCPFTRMPFARKKVVEDGKSLSPEIHSIMAIDTSGAKMVEAINDCIKDIEERTFTLARNKTK